MTATVPLGVNFQQMPTSECRIFGRVTLVHTAVGTWIDERVTLGSTAMEVNHKILIIKGTKVDLAVRQVGRRVVRVLGVTGGFCGG